MPRRHSMNEWFRFFLGTPRRFLASCAGVIVLATIINPELLRIVVERLLIGLSPIIGLLLQIAIVAFGLRIILFGLCRGGNSKKKEKWISFGASLLCLATENKKYLLGGVSDAHIEPRLYWQRENRKMRWSPNSIATGVAIENLFCLQPKRQQQNRSILFINLYMGYLILNIPSP